MTKCIVCTMILASLRWLRNWMHVSCSIALIGVDLMAPVIMQRAWFWTLSRACWVVFAQVDHAVELYSRCGLTDPWKTVFSVFSFAPQVVPANLLRIASLRLAFISAFVMWDFHVIFLIKGDTKVGSFFIFLHGVVAKFDGAGFLLWRQGAECCGGLLGSCV